MEHPIETIKETVESAAHPVETAKDLAAEADRGRSARTPVIVLSGVTLLVSVIVAVLLAITLTLYFVYGGR